MPRSAARRSKGTAASRSASALICVATGDPGDRRGVERHHARGHGGETGDRAPRADQPAGQRRDLADAVVRGGAGAGQVVGRPGLVRRDTLGQAPGADVDRLPAGDPAALPGDDLAAAAADVEQRQRPTAAVGLSNVGVGQLGLAFAGDDLDPPVQLARHGVEEDLGILGVAEHRGARQTDRVDVVGCAQAVVLGPAGRARAGRPRRRSPWCGRRRR